MVAEAVPKERIQSLKVEACRIRPELGVSRCMQSNSRRADCSSGCGGREMADREVVEKSKPSRGRRLLQSVRPPRGNKPVHELSG